MAGARAKKFKIVEPEPEIWVASSTDIVCVANELYKYYIIISDFWTILFWSQSQKLSDVGVEAKNLDAQC